MEEDGRRADDGCATVLPENIVSRDRPPAPVVFYVFDVLVLSGKDWGVSPFRSDASSSRRVLPKLPEPVRYSALLDAQLPVLIQSVKAHRFEGLVAKRRNSLYEPGLRSGAWMKMRVNARTGVRNRRLYPRNEDVRCADLRRLRACLRRSAHPARCSPASPTLLINSENAHWAMNFVLGAILRSQTLPVRSIFGEGTSLRCAPDVLC